MNALATALLELAAFVELSDDETDEDAAVGALESLSATLAGASAEERAALREAAGRLARQATTGGAKGFFEAFMASAGLDDAAAEPVKAKAKVAKAGAKPPTAPSAAAVKSLRRALDFETGDVATVTRLIEKAPALVNAPLDANENRGLHLAALYGHADAVGLLIAAGADVGARDRFGITALHCAAINGHEAIAARLIAAGADVNAAGDKGETPLKWARDRRRDAVAALLTRHGATG